MQTAKYKTRFAQLKRTGPQAIDAIRPGQRVFIGSGCGEPQHLVNTLLDRASGFADLEIVRLLSLESSLVAMMAEESDDRIFNVRSIYLGSGQTRSLKANRRFITPIPLSAVPRIWSSPRSTRACRACPATVSSTSTR